MIIFGRIFFFILFAFSIWFFSHIDTEKYRGRF